MSEIQRMRQKIEAAYRSSEEPTIEVPKALQVMHWISFAKEYIAAASIIDEQAPQLQTHPCKESLHSDPML